MTNHELDAWVAEHVMGGKIEAATLSEAEKVAEATGHTILGEWQGDVDWPEGGDFYDEIIRQRDEEWLK